MDRKSQTKCIKQNQKKILAASGNYRGPTRLQKRGHNYYFFVESTVIKTLYERKIMELTLKETNVKETFSRFKKRLKNVFKTCLLLKCFNCINKQQQLLLLP